MVGLPVGDTDMDMSMADILNSARVSFKYSKSSAYIVAVPGTDILLIMDMLSSSSSDARSSVPSDGSVCDDDSFLVISETASMSLLATSSCISLGMVERESSMRFISCGLGLFGPYSSSAAGGGKSFSAHSYTGSLPGDMIRLRYGCGRLALAEESRYPHPRRRAIHVGVVI